jgi:hypothetical protein
MYGNIFEMKSPFPRGCTLTTDAAALQVPFKSEARCRFAHHRRLRDGTYVAFAAMGITQYPHTLSFDRHNTFNPAVGAGTR